jgi:hypothetical protein
VVAALVSVAGLVSLTSSNSAAGAQVHSYELVNSFGRGGLVDFDSSSTIRQLQTLPDGSVLVVLDRYDTLGQYVSRIAKLRPDGTLDTTFAVTSSTPGFLDVGSAYGSLLVRSAGHLLFGTRQYTASGEVDTSFGVDGYVAHLGVHLSVRLAAFVETSDHSLVMIAEGIDLNHCYIMSVSATGNLETPYPVLPASCHKAFPCGHARRVHSRGYPRPDRPWSLHRGAGRSRKP